MGNALFNEYEDVFGRDELFGEWTGASAVMRPSLPQSAMVLKGIDSIWSWFLNVAAKPCSMCFSRASNLNRPAAGAPLSPTHRSAYLGFRIAAGISREGRGGFGALRNRLIGL
jgi:hypothetical protein